jgi:hypothetical protein
VQPGRPRHGQLSAPLLCMGSWLARYGHVGRPRPCYHLRGSPTRVGAAADGTLRSAIVWRLDLIVLWLRFVTGGSSRLNATCHISFVAAMWLARYVPTINYGWANMRLFARRSVCVRTILHEMAICGDFARYS